MYGFSDIRCCSVLALITKHPIFPAGSFCLFAFLFFKKRVAHPRPADMLHRKSAHQSRPPVSHHGSWCSPAGPSSTLSMAPWHGGGAVTAAGPLHLVTGGRAEPAGGSSCRGRTQFTALLFLAGGLRYVTGWIC